MKIELSESLTKLFKCANSQRLFPSDSLVEQSSHINSHEKDSTKLSRCCFCFGKARNLEELITHVIKQHGSSKSQWLHCFERTKTTQWELIVHQDTFYTTVPKGVILCQCMAIDVNHIFKISPTPKMKYSAMNSIIFSKQNEQKEEIAFCSKIKLIKPVADIREQPLDPPSLVPEIEINPPDIIKDSAMNIVQNLSNQAESTNFDDSETPVPLDKNEEPLKPLDVGTFEFSHFTKETIGSSPNI